MAKAFGLGNGTGIEQVAESKGSIPNPADGLQATSIAIGQSDVQVTPLQVATFIAAIANGGTLYRPQLVEKIQPVTGEAINIFRPQANGTLPLSTENLKAIQDAMRSVVAEPARHGVYPVYRFPPFPSPPKPVPPRAAQPTRMPGSPDTAWPTCPINPILPWWCWSTIRAKAPPGQRPSSGV